MLQLIPKNCFESAKLLYRWRRHLNVIGKNRIYYQCAQQPQGLHQRQRLPLVDAFGVPSFWMLVGFFQLGLALLGHWRFEWLLDTPFKRVLLAVEIFPKEIRCSYAFSMFMIIVAFILCYGFECFCPLVRYKFLAIFVCHPEHDIKPCHLGLTPDSFHKFTSFRNQVERIYYACVVAAIPVATCVWTLLSIHSGAFQVCWFLTLFNIVSFHFWALSVSEVIYAIATQAILVCYYVVLKQRILLDKIERKLHRRHYHWSRLLMERYISLCGEISDYNRFWSVPITILVNCHAIIITYFMYQMCFLEAPFGLFLIYIIGTTMNTTSLVLLLQFSRVFHHDRLLRKHLVRLFNLNRRRIALKTLITMQLLQQNTRFRPAGFTSFDNRLIRTKSYIEIFLNITIVFFFTLKKKSISNL